MSKHVAISPSEAADRLAIREIIKAYAYCADRRDANGQMSLFTPNTHFVVFMNAKDPTPTQVIRADDFPRADVSLQETERGGRVLEIRDIRAMVKRIHPSTG